MRVVSFNVNGIRARFHQLQALVTAQEPDLIGLQEIKVDDAEFPAAELAHLGYQMHWHGQKGHYGVAILHRLQCLSEQKGFPSDEEDAQKRFIHLSFNFRNNSQLHVINGYFPQGSDRNHPVKFPAKVAYYQELRRYLNCHFSPMDQVIVMGDMNVAPQDIDIGIGEDNRKRWLGTGKCAFLPEERELYQAMIDWGLVDTFRQLHPNDDSRFSWFDYRSRGFEAVPKRGLRIDMILASKGLAEQIKDAGIDYSIRAMDKPSDHCPIWAQF